jgi:hypothetical protein
MGMLPCGKLWLCLSLALTQPFMFWHRCGRISWTFSILATPISYIFAFRLKLVSSTILTKRAVHSFGQSSILNMLMLLLFSIQVWRLSRIPMMKDIFPHIYASWVWLNGLTKLEVTRPHGHPLCSLHSRHWQSL